jgi:hypothetical protein
MKILLNLLKLKESYKFYKFIDSIPSFIPKAIYI